MPEAIELQNTFSGGMKRDFPRIRMPAGSLWEAKDVVLDIAGSPIRGRGQLSYQTQIGATTAATAGLAGIYSPFIGFNGTTWVGSDGRMTGQSSSGVFVVVGSSIGLPSELAFYDNKILVAYANGTSAVKAITGDSSGPGAAAIALTAAPPGKYITIFKDVVCVAASSATPDRIYFSEPGDVTSWDLTDGWWEVSHPITGLASMKNAILVFMNGSFARIRGSIPPPGGDFTGDDPLQPVGCSDHRSICYWNDRVLFANAEGIFMTDGTAVENVTEECDMSSWWRSVMAGTDGATSGTAYKYDPATHTIACGIYGSHLFYNVSKGAVCMDAGYIDLKTYSWVRLTQKAVSFMVPVPYPNNLQLGVVSQGGGAYAGGLENFFEPDRGTGIDATSAYAWSSTYFPTIETGLFDAKALSTFQFSWLRYLLSSSANLIVEYNTDDVGDSAGWRNLEDLFVDTGGQVERVHAKIARPGRSVAFRITVNDDAVFTDFRLYSIEASMNPRVKFK